MRNFDGPWKFVLDRYLPRFLELFFPAVHRRVDWRTPPEFLDTELQQILTGAAFGPRSVDRLIRLRLRGGRTVCILVHVEVQERPLRGFARRMYVVSYRIFERRGRHAASLALYTGRGSWRPRPYYVNVCDCRFRLEYPTATLAPHRADREALEMDRNPVAVVVLAHLATQECATPSETYREKLRLIGLVLRPKGGCRRSKKDIINLSYLIDWLLPLPRHLRQRLSSELRRRFGEKTMEHVTSWERDAKAEGRKEGRVEGRKEGRVEGRKEALRDAIRAGIHARFGPAGGRLLRPVERIEELPSLRAFLRALFTAQTIEDLEAHLPSGNGRRAPVRRGRSTATGSARRRRAG